MRTLFAQHVHFVVDLSRLYIAALCAMMESNAEGFEFLACCEMINDRCDK